ncbi:hypothetical protein [Brunnivagina elsteri]|uniref:hypothetical protein n=1 Tax=Brunnivagina elsteri TaxID=1247191 RepID=UPI001B80BA1E|nr:hypothetical protein [Calothrix elsteri]
MTSKLFNQKRYKLQSLISLGKINPRVWRLSEEQILQALRAKGYDVQKIKKMKYLQHQVCISYWDTKGGVCSGFFSYRIFERWQSAVEKLVYACNSLYEMHSLSKLIEYEFTHYPYPGEIQAAISETIEACTCQLTELATYKRNSNLIAS